MTTLLAENFTGTNGAAWNTGNWEADDYQHAGTGGSGSSSIDTNRGKMVVAPIAIYSSSMTKVSKISEAETDYSIAFTLDRNASGTGEHVVNIYARVSGGWHNANSGQPGNGYWLSIGYWGELALFKRVSEATTQLGSGVAWTPPSAGTPTGVRFETIGSTVRARAWTGSEPDTWNITRTDSSLTAGGFALQIGNYNTTAALESYFDSLTVEDTTIGGGSPPPSDSAALMRTRGYPRGLRRGTHK